MRVVLAHSSGMTFVSLSAKRTGAQEDVAAARRTWSRVARRVLRSKNKDTRDRWLKRLKDITGYMLRRMKSVPKGKVSQKVKAQMEYVQKYVALYNRIIKALSQPYKEGTEKLADIRIPKPGQDIKLEPHEVKVKVPEVKQKAKEKPAEPAKVKPAKPSRKEVLKKHADALAKAVKDKFQLVVNMKGLLDKAAKAYADTKSAEAKLKLELIGKRFNEVKANVIKAKQARDKFQKKFQRALAA